MPVAIQVPSPQSGSFTAVVKDNNGDPTTVLDANQDFVITCEWDINTALALVLEGTFELAAYAEAIGQGLEQRIGFLSVPVVIGQQIYPLLTWSWQRAHCRTRLRPGLDDSGVYKLIIVLTHRNTAEALSVTSSPSRRGPFARIASRRLTARAAPNPTRRWCGPPRLRWFRLVR